MLPQKIKSIIFSCATIPQLDTCAKWVEYLYQYNDLVHLEAIEVISHRAEQLAICGIKSMTPQLIDELHKMD